MVRVGIVLFDDVDLLDVGGPYEVLLTANRLVERRGEKAPFDLVTASPGGRPVVAYGGMGLVPHSSLAALGHLDVVIVPGAIIIDEVLARADVMRAIGDLLETTDVAASVCTGAFILADAGLLEGRTWTTHWEDISELVERHGLSGAERAAWVDAGDVVTAGGLSSGLAMALHLVDRFAGRTTAVATAEQLDYRWDPDEGIRS